MTSEKAYSYDVAISYAGEDRDYVQALADALRQQGVSVFYDRYEKATLWGKNLYDYLSDLYQNRARYCVMLLSHHYAAKVWTSHEREAAQNRAVREHEEYILPIRLDDMDLSGHLQTIVYLNWREETIETIVEALLYKLKREISPVSSSPSSRKTAEEWTKEGHAHCKLGQYEEALAAYDQAILLGSQNIDVYFNRGFVLDELGRYEAAVAAYEQAIRLNPQDSSVYINKGHALSKLERYEEALVTLEEAIRLDPQNSTACRNKGFALNKLGYHKESLKAYDKAQQLEQQKTK
jgi:tetratricopeptide (TPR) repeat protein